MIGIEGYKIPMQELSPPGNKASLDSLGNYLNHHCRIRTNKRLSETNPDVNHKIQIGSGSGIHMMSQK